MILCGLVTVSILSSPSAGDTYALRPPVEAVSDIVGSASTMMVSALSETPTPPVEKPIVTSLWPVSGTVTSEFGDYEPLREAWGIGRHSGIDIANTYGTPIHAFRAGTVTEVTAVSAGACGKNIVIDHGDGVMSRYCHLSKPEVIVGQLVLAGDEIGLMGSTGASTGSHLHFQITVNGQVVNPHTVISGGPEA